MDNLIEHTAVIQKNYSEEFYQVSEIKEEPDCVLVSTIPISNGTFPIPASGEYVLS